MPDVQTLQDLLRQYSDRKKYIILNENVAQMQPSPFFKVYAVELQFGQDEWYWAGTGMCLTKSALMRVCSALSISIISSVRTDANDNPDYAHYNVIGAMRMPDGTPRSMSGSKSFDVNDVIEDNIKSAIKKRDEGKGNAGKSDAQIRAEIEQQRTQLRRAKAERAESGALERMVRAMGAMATSYKQDDAKKTFVALVTTPDLDTLFMDPAIRQAAALQAVGAAAQLYGTIQNPPAQPALAPASQPQLAAPSSAGAPAAPETPAVDPKQVKIDEWASVEPPIRIQYISKLWTERQHSYGSKAWTDLMGRSADDQARFIVEHLEPLPMKAADPAPSESPAEAMPPAPATAPSAPSNHRGPNEAQIKRLYTIGRKYGYDNDAVHALLAEKFGGITEPADLTYEQYDWLCGNDRKNIPSWIAENPAGQRNSDVADLFAPSAADVQGGAR